ncbi:MAG: polysaccharide biosynthesis tyrosine autokinase [Deltaproteobacteria bacterium]|nr:polysaccharide biosynthesis tyrosine autokinase [Deltaproteobacteria bacterium]
MGKLSDAFERQEKERSIRTETLRTETPAESAPEQPARTKRARKKTSLDAVKPSESPGAVENLEDFIIKDPELSRIQKAAAGRKYHPKLVVVTAPESVDSENFKILRAKIQLSAREGFPCRTIMVTSTYPGEGKSFVACNLAASIACGIDEHVMLVDCDLRRPQVHQYFGYAPSRGLSDYLSGRGEIPGLLIKTDIPKLTFMAAGTPPGNPAELVSSNKMETFIDEVRARYDDRYVILDATPTQFTSESSVLSRHVDGILLVVMAHRSPRKAVQNGMRSLAKESLLGVVFNGYNEPLKSYRKYYAGYYHK